jgi:hypothetical protein
LLAGESEVAPPKVVKRIIENVRNYCYLGGFLSISGLFSFAKTDIYKKGLKAFFKFSKSFNGKKTICKDISPYI